MKIQTNIHAYVYSRYGWKDIYIKNDKAILHRFMFSKQLSTFLKSTIHTHSYTTTHTRHTYIQDEFKEFNKYPKSNKSFDRRFK